MVRIWALRSVLADSGIAVLGGTRSTTDSLQNLAARQGAALAEVSSRPVKDWIFPVLNTSQNWYAEMLLKQRGRQFGGAGSWKAGLEVERRFLIDSMKVDSTQFALRDGSGLSSSNLVSPRAFATLLTWMRRHPRFESFAAGLPQSGQRGSLKTRFVGTPLEGKVRRQARQHQPCQHPRRLHRAARPHPHLRRRGQQPPDEARPEPILAV